MLHWIYPGLCELCHEPCEQELCEDCIAKLPALPLPICLYCGSPVAGDQHDPTHCAQCAAAPRYYDFARSAYLTNEAPPGEEDIEKMDIEKEWTEDEH